MGMLSDDDMLSNNEHQLPMPSLLLTSDHSLHRPQTPSLEQNPSIPSLAATIKTDRIVRPSRKMQGLGVSSAIQCTERI